MLSRLLGIGGAVILVALVRHKWKYMSWGFSSAPNMPYATEDEIPVNLEPIKIFVGSVPEV